MQSLPSRQETNTVGAAWPSCTIGKFCLDIVALGVCKPAPPVRIEGLLRLSPCANILETKPERNPSTLFRAKVPRPNADPRLLPQQALKRTSGDGPQCTHGGVVWLLPGVDDQAEVHTRAARVGKG